MEEFFTNCGIKRILNNAGISFETKTENVTATATITNKGQKIVVSKNIESYLEKRKAKSNIITHDFLINNTEKLAEADALKKAYLIFKRINKNNEN